MQKRRGPRDSLLGRYRGALRHTEILELRIGASNSRSGPSPEGARAQPLTMRFLVMELTPSKGQPLPQMVLYCLTGSGTTERFLY